LLVWPRYSILGGDRKHEEIDESSPFLVEAIHDSRLRNFLLALDFFVSIFSSSSDDVADGPTGETKLRHSEGSPRESLLSELRDGRSILRSETTVTLSRLRLPVGSRPLILDAGASPSDVWEALSIPVFLQDNWCTGYVLVARKPT